jgi:hypothetical protein
MIGTFDIVTGKQEQTDRQQSSQHLTERSGKRTNEHRSDIPNQSETEQAAWEWFRSSNSKWIRFTNKNNALKSGMPQTSHTATKHTPCLTPQLPTTPQPRQCVF